MRRSLSCVLRASVIAFLAQQAVASEPDRDARIVVGWGEPIDTLNPATTGNRDVGPLDVNIFDTLVWLTPDFKITPDLATKWEVSPDGKTYTFTLRDDVTFHDGTPFDAAAVVANVSYVAAKSTQSKVALGLFGPCTSAMATAKYTVQISCTTPYAPLLMQLGEPYAGMQSPKAMQDYGKDLGLHPTGTGPFSFVSYTPGQSIVVKRNEAYTWGPAATGHTGAADIAQITFQIVTSPQARVSQFQAGQSEMMQETPGVFWNALQKSDRYTAIPVPISGLGIFMAINAARWPTDDVAVRRAIEFAVDKTGAIQLADAGVFPVSNAPLAMGMIGYDPSLETLYRYDPTQAAEALKAAGWTKPGAFWEKDGKPLTIKLTAISTSTESPLISQAVQGYLRKAGMDASVEMMAGPAWLAANIKGESTMAPSQYIGVDPDALHLWYLPDQYFNWAHYSNAELTSLIMQGQQETDPAKRPAIYAKVQKIIMDEAIVLPLHQNIDLVMTQKKLVGVTWSGGGFEYFGAAYIAK